MAAVARIDDRTSAEAAAAAGPLALVLVGVSDPGNAGTLLRTAEAAGAGAVVFCGGSVDPFGPKCVRSSAGSLFRLAVTRAADSDAALAALAARGIRTVATLARDAPPYDAADLAGRWRWCSATRPTACRRRWPPRSTGPSRSRWRAGPSRSTWAWRAPSCASRRCASGGRIDWTARTPRAAGFTTT